jgi:hypothetical protein
MEWFGTALWRTAQLGLEIEPYRRHARQSIMHGIKDLSLNGDRPLTGQHSLLDHIEIEHLVQWAFAPGTRLDGTPREKPPLSYPEFVTAFTTWVNAGGPCPAQ